MDEYIGTMHIVGKLNSYNYNTGIDVFQNKGSATMDHIWPKAKRGSNLLDNKQKLTRMSNDSKANNIKGYINDIRYTVLQYTIDDFDNVIGTMYISYDDGANWYEVTNN